MRSLLVVLTLLISGCGTLQFTDGYVSSDIPGVARAVFDATHDNSLKRHQCQGSTTEAEASIVLEEERVGRKAPKQLTREIISARVSCRTEKASP